MRNIIRNKYINAYKRTNILMMNNQIYRYFQHFKIWKKIIIKAINEIVLST